MFRGDRIRYIIEGDIGLMNSDIGAWERNVECQLSSIFEIKILYFSLSNFDNF